MAKFEVQFRVSVEKELKTIPQKDHIRLLERIALLAEDPHPPTSKKLSGLDRYRV
jgi:mRNA interferase RelE/StbE